MLDTPEPLAGTATEPRYAGPLTFEAGPERIETGWWDEAGIARDYYVARNPAGAELWVFRNRGNGSNWYLHGLFG
jgi:protein ImuB